MLTNTSPSQDSVSGLYEFDNGLGVFCVHQCNGYIHITSLAIREEERNKGHGHRMMQEMVTLLGSHTLRLEVLSFNAPALAIYRAAGFTAVPPERCMYLSGGQICEMERAGNQSVARFTQSGAQKEV